MAKLSEYLALVDRSLSYARNLRRVITVLPSEASVRWLFADAVERHADAKIEHGGMLSFNGGGRCLFTPVDTGPLNAIIEIGGGSGAVILLDRNIEPSPALSEWREQKAVNQFIHGIAA